MVEPSRARDEALYGRELGFRWLKVKVGGELRADVARLEAVASVLAPV